MKTVVIPDVHNKVAIADAILKTEAPYDKVIFLGDYFDDFGDSPLEARVTAHWLKKSLTNENHIHLMGNHDVHYASNYPGAQCSGFEPEKREAINDIMTVEDWKKLKFFHMAQGWLFTHAGFDATYLNQETKTKTQLKKFLTDEGTKCRTALRDQKHHWFYLAGDARRYFRLGIPAGGILWCDANQEFVSPDIMPQIFGHTPQRGGPTLIPYSKPDGGNGARPKFIEYDKPSINPKDRWNVALDCHLKFYGILNGEEFSVKPI